MTDIRVEAFTMPAAPVGSCNPLPDLKTVQYVHSTVTVDPSLSEEEAKISAMAWYRAFCLIRSRTDTTVNKS